MGVFGEVAHLGVAVYDVSVADELDALVLDLCIFLAEVLHYRA